MPKLSSAQVEARRLEVLAACLRCFSRSGFQATTIQDLAKEAGIAVGTFYLYFRDKEAALSAIAEANVERTGEFLAAIETVGDPLEAILRLFESATEMRKGSELKEAMQLELQLWAHAATESEFADLIRTSLELWKKALARLVRRAQRDRPVAPWLGRQTPAAGARVLFALLNGYFVLAALEERTSRQARADRKTLLETVEILIRGA